MLWGVGVLASKLVSKARSRACTQTHVRAKPGQALLKEEAMHGNGWGAPRLGNCESRAAGCGQSLTVPVPFSP